MDINYVPPRPPLETLAELYAYWSGSGYELINNLWGRDAATSGSQTTFVDAVSPRGDGVQWHTTWTWTGAPDRVKSYPYAGRQIERGRTISSVRSMPTSVEWAYDVENVKANVAYDLFTARDKDHVNSSGDFELMIWLARYDVYPIGSSVQCVNICGIMWDLWIGFNGEMKVYSFVPMPGVTIRSFRGDVREFFGFLERFDRFPAQDQHLIVFQVGTECFTGGPATFTCNHFSADVI
ncbi:glycoside hydrolase family 12 protein [Echria macrotheca]|uniref:Glycoside hydrolase family 12 protein n=1 Tax=Echria macrotheca TaxID=438768 RepID=A0AAJ0FF38_9PEZI|nr:glycoside hydrolase family 12 protein [Echria macrotheca]